MKRAFIIQGIKMVPLSEIGNYKDVSIRRKNGRYTFAEGIYA